MLFLIYINGVIQIKYRNKIDLNNFNLIKNKSKVKQIYKFLELYELRFNKKDCNFLDPINIFKQRFNTTPAILCENENSRHICFQDQNPIFAYQKGVSCEFNDVIIDPFKWRRDGYIYKGPMDYRNYGRPLINNGFFGMKCKGNPMTEYKEHHSIYNNYFKAWNYKYNEKEELEELSPGKTVFFISRNQDSPNLFHGGSEFINALSIMYLLNLYPEDIQIVFLESIQINDDPFYNLYKYLIGRGGEPIHIRNLKKKYHIEFGVHIPINWDSPCFIKKKTIPNCTNNPTKTYFLYNKLIDLYMNPRLYKDFIDNKKAFYYPNKIINLNKKKNKFDKIVTFQWRRVWPKDRKGQHRILGNGPELADKISQLLPDNILIRLIDTAILSINEQISIMRNTDYFLGTHGAGLSLILYAPKECIFHEISNKRKMKGLALFASLSGHKVYRDIIKADIKKIDGNEVLYFNEDYFIKSVINHMKENNFI